MRGHETRGWVGGALLLAPALSQAGCESNACTDQYVASQATFRLHLPPAADVLAPETVTACQEPVCATATVPAVDSPGVAGTLVFSNAQVSGTVALEAGQVRAVDIAWQLTDVLPADPRNAYDITVTDAAGQVTGKVSAQVNYAKTPSGPCGPGVWIGPLTSD